MLDDDSTSNDSGETTPKAPRRRGAGRPAGPPVALSTDIFAVPGATAPEADAPVPDEAPTDEPAAPAKKAPAKKTAARKAPAKKTAARKAPAKKATVPVEELPLDEALADDEPIDASLVDEGELDEAGLDTADEVISKDVPDEAPATPARKVLGGAVMFQAPEAVVAPRRRPVVEQDDGDGPVADNDSDSDSDTDVDNGDDDTDSDGTPRRRRRSRGGRRRRRGESDGSGDDDGDTDTESNDESSDASDDSAEGQGTTRRRRRRARAGEDAATNADDPENTIVRVREGRSAEDEITGVAGSTRLEAKKQRRREGREAGRRRAPIVSEAEFLARRESVKREMIVRQRHDYTQIVVLEDDVLVEHYVARESQISIIGNVYLGKVQNVLPSMEAAFVDIGAGRNAVLYAGEVDWSTFGNGKQRKIEDALSPGQTVLVQATKDPIGQKGARLTSQISLPGRYLVYVPRGHSNGISRKLPENERARLKGLLKEVLPEDAGVIVRTAAEGATEDQLTRDVTALAARWEDIERKVEAGKAPELLYSEPDLTIKVVRDLFNEDFASLVVEGQEAWDMVAGYIDHVAPDLADRVKRWDGDQDTFAAYRIDEQILKALERKVHLPSGGSLIIDRTEAMTVVDVNTGKFTGSGGNLEETVTKNNLEAAEEIVRQLRLRDIGGIIVIDFIDMVLESNRDLVLRRLVECLGRDRTRHQVAEVTSLGLVQMTRKRIGTGLLESFSTECEHCKGRGVVIESEPVEPKKDESRRGRRGGGSNGGGGGRGRGGNGGGNNHDSAPQVPSHTGQPADAPRPPTLTDESPAPEPAERPTEPEKALDKAPVAPPAEAPSVEATPVEAPSVEPAPVKKAARSRSRKAVRPAGQAAPAQAPTTGETPAAQPVSDPAPEAEKRVDPVVDPASDAPVLTSEGDAP